MKNQGSALDRDVDITQMAAPHILTLSKVMLSKLRFQSQGEMTRGCFWEIATSGVHVANEQDEPGTFQNRREHSQLKYSDRLRAVAHSCNPNTLGG